MASNFDRPTSLPVTVILPNGRSATWREFYTTARPSGIVFRFRLAPATATPDVVAGEAGQWADAFNQKSLVSGVESISTYQDIDANNQIEDRMTVIVASDSGESESSLDMPQSWLQQATFAEKVEAAREQLNAFEAL